MSRKKTKPRHVSPTPAEHLHLFNAAVEDYERLDAAYPLGNRFNPFTEVEEQRRWQVLLHAAVLRKFFASDDNLFIGTVLPSIRACLIPLWPWDEDMWQRAYTNGPLVGDLAEFQVGDQDPLKESDILRQELYGRYLHGDHEKWVATSRRPNRTTDNAVFFATLHQKERLFDTVYMVRTLTRDGFLFA